PRGIGIRDGMEDAKRFEGTDMVAAPITTSKDCDTRFHTPCARLAWRTHIHAARATQPRYGLACRALSTMFSAIQSRRLICRPEWLSIGPRGRGIRGRFPSSVAALTPEATPPAFRKGFNLQVLVRENNVDQALRVLKKKLQREGLFREMKARSAYEKPSEKRAREKAEAVRRARKLARKKAQREGLLPAPKKAR